MSKKTLIVMLLLAVPACGALVAEKNFDGGTLGTWDFISLPAPVFSVAGPDWTLVPDASGGLAASKPSGAAGNGIYAQGTGLTGTIGRFEIDIRPNWSGRGVVGPTGGIGDPGAAQNILQLSTGLTATPLNLLIFNNGWPNDGGQLMCVWGELGVGAQTLSNTPQQPGTNSQIAGTTANWVAGEWHSIVFEWSPTTLTLLLDGLRVSQLPRNPAITFTGANGLYIDGWGAGYQNPFDGAIDNIKFYDTPEPATMILLGLGGLGLLRRRR